MKLVPSAKRPCRLERGEIRRVPQDRANLLVGYHVCCLRCGFNTPALAAEAMRAGAHAVVVGSAITRPEVIAGWFAAAVASAARGN